MSREIEENQNDGEVLTEGHDEKKVADEDEWMNCMRERLVSGRDDGPFHQEHLIYRVHSSLRNENPSCYEPIAISIGPYHHGKKHLLAMETLKKQYFRDLLRRNTDDRFEDLVKKMKDSQDRARGCYPEKIKLESKAFIEMMLLDGCFIVEFLLKSEGLGQRDHSQLFDGPVWRFTTLQTRDLLLFENQLPFFLLQEIFQFVMPNETDPKQALVKLSLKLLESINPIKPRNEEVLSIVPESVHHLLHLWHTRLIPFAAKQPKIPKSNNLVLCLGMCNCCKGEILEVEKCMWMPGATDLEGSGIKFKASSRNLLEIEFSNGEMIIPMIYVQDDTETQLRNLIAFEQCCLKPSSRDYYFTSYTSFLDLLINTSKDVEILHKKGILTHWLGEDEEVALLFNKLAKGVFVNENYLANTFKSVNEYRCRKIHRRLFLQALGRALRCCYFLCHALNQS